MAAHAGAGDPAVLIEVGCLWLTLVMLCCSGLVRPRVARCPVGFYVNGVRPSGVYECRRVPGGNPLYDGAAGYPDRTVDRPGWYRSRIWCTGGSVPIVVLEDREARTVGCSMRSSVLPSAVPSAIDLQIAVPTVMVPAEQCRHPDCTTEAAFIAVDESCDTRIYACADHLGALLTDHASWHVAAIALVDRQLKASGQDRPWSSKRIVGAAPP